MVRNVQRQISKMGVVLLFLRMTRAQFLVAITTMKETLTESALILTEMGKRKRNLFIKTENSILKWPGE